MNLKGSSSLNAINMPTAGRAEIGIFPLGCVGREPAAGEDSDARAFTERNDDCRLFKFLKPGGAARSKRLEISAGPP
jgi:hypothetical protein